MCDDDSNLFNFINAVGIKWNEVPNKNEYPFNVPSIASIDTIKLNKPVTFFCGENGTGKSTLLEGISIAIGLNPEGGTKNYRFSIKETHSELCEYLSLRRSVFRPVDSFFVRSDTMYNLFTEIDTLGDNDRYYDGRSLHRRSHGEGILTLISRRFKGKGLYILDEPETGLSQSAQIALLCEIIRLVDLRSQFIIATHSPILLSLPNSYVYQFDDAIYPIDAKDSLEWNILCRFLDNPDKIIKEYMNI